MSMSIPSLLVLALLATLKPASSPDAAVAALLDTLHASAARADEAAYFACFAQEGVFLGTDATERWTVPAFREYAHPLFAQGKGWTYVPQVRHVDVDRGGRVAWFDEVLRNEKYGACRGTGVAVRTRDGWRIAQYSLTFLVPNDAAGAVVETIRATPPK